MKQPIRNSCFIQTPPWHHKEIYIYMNILPPLEMKFCIQNFHIWHPEIMNIFQSQKCEIWVPSSHFDGSRESPPALSLGLEPANHDWDRLTNLKIWFESHSHPSVHVDYLESPCINPRSSLLLIQYHLPSSLSLWHAFKTFSPLIFKNQQLSQLFLFVPLQNYEFYSCFTHIKTYDQDLWHLV